MSCFLVSCSAGQWQVIEEHLVHRCGDVRGRAVWLRCWFYWRPYQGLPVWCVLTFRQGERSALPCSVHRYLTSAHTQFLVLVCPSELPMGILTWSILFLRKYFVTFACSSLFCEMFLGYLSLLNYSCNLSIRGSDSGERAFDFCCEWAEQQWLMTILFNKWS